MVHGLGEFLEGSFEGKWLPAFATIERQAVGTAAERSESEPRICAVLVSATNDQVTATRSHVETTGRVACVEQ